MAADGGKLKLYVDLLSPPARAVALFCRINGSEAEEIFVSIFKGQTQTPEYKEINPMQKVPTIVEEGFKLRERYPTDPKRRAVIDSVLDWIPMNISKNMGPLIYVRVLNKIPNLERANRTQPDELNLEAPNSAWASRIEPNEKLEADCAKQLRDAFGLVEAVLLRGPGKFLENGEKVSLADIVMACEPKQLGVFDAKYQKELLGSGEKITAWMDAVINATKPHFDQVHVVLSAFVKQLQDGTDMALEFHM